MFKGQEEPKRKRSKVYLLWVIRKFNLILAFVSAVFNILFLVVMIFNFNLGFILFMVNIYNIAMLLLKYKHENKMRKRR